MSAFIFIGVLAFTTEANFTIASFLWTFGISAGTVTLSALGYGWVIRKGVMDKVDETKKELSKDIDGKVDQTIFDAHCLDNEKQHKDIIYIRNRLDGYIDSQTKAKK